jgi:hypothetical protein
MDRNIDTRSPCEALQMYVLTGGAAFEFILWLYTHKLEQLRAKDCVRIIHSRIKERERKKEKEIVFYFMPTDMIALRHVVTH